MNTACALRILTCVKYILTMHKKTWNVAILIASIRNMHIHSENLLRIIYIYATAFSCVQISLLHDVFV